MKIVTLRVVLYLHQVYSRKEQRRIVKSIIERSQHRFHVSAADISHDDLMNRVEIAFVTVSNDYSLGEKVMQKIMNEIDNRSDVEIIFQEIEFL